MMARVRSAVAVMGGIGVFTVALFAMAAGGNWLLGAEPEWINRSTTTQVVWLAWNVIAMVGGGYVAARIAARAKVAHAVVMGSIQTLFTLVAMLTVANTTPAWLWIAGIVSTVPTALIGGTIARQTHSP